MKIAPAFLFATWCSCHGTPWPSPPNEIVVRKGA
jgi:hypothetical protein